MFSRLLEVARDRAGAAIVEFAIVLPLLIIVLFGILQFGIYFYEYVQVENAAATAERVFLQNRPFPTPSSICPATCPNSCPYSNAVSAVQNSTSLSLTENNVAMSVGGTACASDSSCGAALCTAYSTTGSYSAAQTASVQVSYPCPSLLGSWIPLFCPGGVVQATYTQRVD